MSLLSHEATTVSEPPVGSRDCSSNIENLFNRLTAIENELEHGQHTLSHDRGHTVWSRSSCEEDLTTCMQAIAGRSKSYTLPGSIRFRDSLKPRDAAPVTDHLREFQASETAERCRFLELELGRANARIRSLMSGSGCADRSRLKSLNQQLEELNANASTTSVELQLARDEVRNLSRVNSALRQKNLQLTAENEKVRHAAEKVKKRLLVLRSANSRLTDSVTTISSRESYDLATARDSARQAELKSTGLRQQLSSIEAQLFAAAKENKTLSERIRVQVGDNGKLKDELEKVVGEKEQLSEAVVELEKRLRAVETDRTRVREQPSPVAPITEALVASLVSQLSEAKEEAATARAETTQARAQMAELRLRCMQAVHRERHQRGDLNESLVSSKERTCSVTRSADQANQVYLRKIKKMQNQINGLNEHIFELEKRELHRAPVVVSRRGRAGAAECAPPLVSFDGDEVNNRPEPVQFQAQVPTVVSHTVDEDILTAPDLLNSSNLF